MRKIVLIFLSVIVLILIVSGIYSYIYLKRSVPQKSGSLFFPQLQDSVEITFDKMGIPQVWAESEKDGYFALGYLHAADRLFQMDITRHVAQGRLSELFGKRVLDFDRVQRKVGHHRIAEEHIRFLTDSSRTRLQAYSKGVNAYVKSCEVLPFEYALLRKDFKPWTVFDVLCILNFQTWFSDFLQNPDQTYLKMVEQVGAQRVAELIKGYPDWAPKTVPQEPAPLSLKGRFQNHMAENFLNSGPFPFLMTTSSNSWVVRPERSKSGAAILASDPHLEISRLPQFWYAAGLHIRETGLNVLGISTPGLPFMVMGHNGKAAWAFTVGGIDVTEYYLEKIHPEDSTRYKTPQGWQRFIEFEEVIEVDGSKNDTVVVKMSHHGPVLVENDSLGTIYSFHWAGFDMPLEQAVEAGFRLPKTDNFPDFRRTVTRFGALDANWTYADAQGNIGYQLGTPIPIRPEKLGVLPAPGWEEGYEWLGYRPLEETPHSYNPARGWLATCNNKQDQANIDYELQGYFAADRILRITELLRSGQMFSAEDMQRYQMDLVDKYLLHWKDKLVPLLQKYDHPDAAQKLSRWNGETGADSWETAFLKLFRYHFKHLTLDDDLNKKTERINRVLIEALFDEGDAFWFDDKSTEDITERKEEIIRKSIDTALTVTNGKRWGDFNRLTMKHPLAVVPLLGDILRLKQGPWDWHGTAGTLNSAFVKEDTVKGGFKTIVGPSWRFVIDFADVNSATMVLPAGNSGNPISPHFMDFLALWKSGKHWTVPFDYNAVKTRAVSILRLYPEKKKG